jgi:hypothetical protein
MATYPSKHDGPSQIRTYLANVLIMKHNVSATYAKSTVSRWSHGREQHLRELSREDFQRFFGNIGFYLYDSVSEDTATAWHSTPAGALNLLLMCGMPILAIILLSRLYRHTQRASFRSGSLPFERLLWVSGPILLICNAQEAAHHSKLSQDCLFFVGIGLCYLGIIAMIARFTRTVVGGL